MKKIQIKLLLWVTKPMNKRNEKNHRKLNECNDCGAVMVPLYQISILNLVFYLIIGIVIAIAWNIFVGLAIVIGSIVINLGFVKPECRTCRSYNIDLYIEVPPTKVQQSVAALDKQIEDAAKPSEEEVQLRELESTIVTIKDEVRNSLEQNKNEAV